MRVVLLAVGVLLTGCGSQVAAQDEPLVRPDAIPAADGLVRTAYAATVLDDGDGPELCLGAVAASLPPQCSGLALTGWEWDDLEHEASGGTRWTARQLVGTFDGTTFDIETVVPVGEETRPGEDRTDLSSPCEDVPGWSGDDPAQVTAAALDAAGRAVRRLPDLGPVWMDRSRDLRSLEDIDQDLAAGGEEDVSTWILNVSVTDDLARAEQAVREHWGGGLCVSRAEYSEAELLEVRQELGSDLPGLLGSGSFKVVDLEVVHDDGSIQAWLDQEYGAGVVTVSSLLLPAAGLDSAP